MQVNQEDRLTPEENNKGTNSLTIVIIALVILIAGGAYYYFSSDSEALPEMEVAEITLPEPAPKEPIVVQEQITEPDVAPTPISPVVSDEVSLIDEPKQQVEPLPSLDNSDNFIKQKIITLVDGMDIQPLLLDKDIARKTVVFVDNIAQGNLARNASPLKGPEQQFTATDIAGKTYLNPDSYHRYDVYANLLANLNDQQLVATYKLIYPLLNQAFSELGYEKINFNDRAQSAIQEMLDAPIINEPIELSSISVNYQFVDPTLEALPAAQKLMVRMGPENSQKVKNALQRLQDQLLQQ